jgi:hypothetical protein
MARSRIARKTKGWIETIISLVLALIILATMAAGLYYLVVIV